MRGRERNQVALLCCILVVLSLVVGFLIPRKPKIVTEIIPLEIEIPVEIVKEIPVIEIHTIEIPVQVPIPIYINNTKIIYVPTPMPLADWENQEELMTFIEIDQTDRIKYSNDFDCDDFTLRMIHNAAEIGRRVYYFYEWKGGTRNGNHIMCMAYVKEEALYIIWEPQTDDIWSMWSSTVGG